MWGRVFESVECVSSGACEGMGVDVRGCMRGSPSGVIMVVLPKSL